MTKNPILSGQVIPEIIESIENMKLDRSKEDNLYSKIEELLVSAREKVVKQVNQAMVYTYFEIGRIIVESE